MLKQRVDQNVFRSIFFLSLKIIILSFIFKIDSVGATLSDLDQQEITPSLQRVDITNSEFGASTTWSGEEPLSFYQGDFTRIHFIVTLTQTPAYDAYTYLSELSFPIMHTSSWNIGLVPYFSTHYQGVIDNQYYDWLYLGWYS